MSMWHLWTNDNHTAHVQAKAVPINLIWSELAQWSLSYSIRKVPNALMPVGTPMWPRWTNNHGVAHPQAKTFLMNLIWSQSAQWLWSSNFRKIPAALFMPIGMAMWLCKWPWRCTSTGQDSSNELDLVWIHPVVAEFWHRQGSKSMYYAHGHVHVDPWANYHDVTHLQAKMVPVN